MDIYVIIGRTTCLIYCMHLKHNFFFSYIYFYIYAKLFRVITLEISNFGIIGFNNSPFFL